MLAVNRRQKERRICWGDRVPRTRLSVNPVLFPLTHTHPQTRSDTERNYLPVPYPPVGPRQHLRRSRPLRWLHSRIHLCLHHTERAEQPPSKIRMSPRGRAARYRRNFGTRRYQSQLPCYPLDGDSSRAGMGYLPGSYSRGIRSSLDIPTHDLKKTGDLHKSEGLFWSLVRLR